MAGKHRAVPRPPSRKRKPSVRPPPPPPPPPPAFLERVVVDLLIAMGYGGGDAARGRVTGP